MKKNKLIKIICHSIFILFFFVSFYFFSFLRPAAFGALYKEYLAAIIVLIMLYINYLLLIPKFYLKQNYNVFLILSLSSIFIATAWEMLLITPNSITCLPSSFTEQDIRKTIILQSFLVGGRNMALFLFFFVIRIFENEKQTLEKERIAIAKNQGFICVPSGKDTIKTINISSIYYVLHEKNYTYINTIDGNRYCKYCSLSNMTKLLPETFFLRINRNVIIPLNRIVRYSQDSVTMSYGNPTQEITFPLSEKYVPNVKEILTSTVGLNHLVDGLNSQNDGLNNLSGGLNNSVNKTNLGEFLANIENNEELLTLCRIIAKEPSVTMKSLSDQLKVSLKTVERRLKILKNKGILLHCGAKKNGEYVFSPSISDSVINWLTTD